MRVIRSVPKLLVVAVVAYAIARMWHWKIGFTYFTQLSNLFCAGAMLLQLWAESRPGQAPRVARDVKFAATTSIVATGVIYLTVLAPLEPQGMLAAYAQDGWASLCLHGIVPALFFKKLKKHAVKRNKLCTRDHKKPSYIFVHSAVHCAMCCVLLRLLYRFLGGLSSAALSFSCEKAGDHPSKTGVCFYIFSCCILLCGMI